MPNCSGNWCLSLPGEWLSEMQRKETPVIQMNFWGRQLCQDGMNFQCFGNLHCQGLIKIVRGAILSYICKYNWFLGAQCTCADWTNRHPVGWVRLRHTFFFNTEEWNVFNSTTCKHANGHNKPYWMCQLQLPKSKCIPYWHSCPPNKTSL